jgi:hypothetical protein
MKRAQVHISKTFRIVIGESNVVIECSYQLKRIDGEASGLFRRSCRYVRSIAELMTAIWHAQVSGAQR